MRDARSAGIVPNSNAVAMDTAAVNVSTRQSTDTSRTTRSNHVESCATSNWLPQPATAGRRSGAETGEHEAFDEQLLHQSPARCAERQPHAQFTAVGCGSRKQQIRDVGARDEQDERAITRIVTSDREY